MGFQVSYDKSVLKNYSCWGLYINLIFFMRSCLLRHSGKWCVSNSLTIKHLSSKGRGSHQERNLSSLKHSLLAVSPFMNWINNCLLKIILKKSPIRKFTEMHPSPNCKIYFCNSVFRYRYAIILHFCSETRNEFTTVLI